jgi:hypothetical protein
LTLLIKKTQNRFSDLFPIKFILKSMSSRVIILSLVLVIFSCSKTPKASKPDVARPEPQSQKLHDLTKHLYNSVKNLRCKEVKGWNEAKERATRLIWNVEEADQRVPQIKGFLESLKSAEAMADIQTCETLLKATENNIKNLENSFPKQKQKKSQAQTKKLSFVDKFKQKMGGSKESR